MEQRWRAPIPVVALECCEAASAHPPQISKRYFVWSFSRVTFPRGSTFTRQKPILSVTFNSDLIRMPTGGWAIASASQVADRPHLRGGDQSAGRGSALGGQGGAGERPAGKDQVRARTQHRPGGRARKRNR